MDTTRYAPGPPSSSPGARPGSLWPDFLVIGAPRSGTTTLHAVLDAAPSICMSAVKEPKYFHCSDEFSFFSGRIKETAEYLNLWSSCSPSQLKGEVSPTYFHDPSCPGAVKEVIPSARLVLILRNPVDRAISHFHFRERRTGKSSITLGEALDRAESSRAGDYESSYLLEPGFFGRHLRCWLEQFDREQIKILLLDRLTGDFQTEMEGLFAFLGLPVENVVDLHQLKRNASSLPRTRAAGRLMQADFARRLVRLLRAERLAVSIGGKLLMKRAEYPAASAADRARLFTIYRDDIRKFEELTGLDTGWLRQE